MRGFGLGLGLHTSRHAYDGGNPKPTPDPEYARTALAATSRVIHSGHSLTDAYVHYGPWPGNFRHIATSLGIADAEAQHIKAVIVGSWIKARYEGDATAFAEGERPYANADQYNALMITEAGPPPHYTADRDFLKTETLDYLCRFTANMVENGAGNEVILWSIWPDLRGPGYPATYAGWTGRTFRESLPDYGHTFRFMSDYVSWKMQELYPSLPAGWRAWIVPGHRWMMRVYDDIQLGLVPGFTDIDELFDDEIHPTPIADYGLACLVATVMYQVNLTQAENVYIAPAHTAANQVEWPAVTQAQAEYFWQIAWQIATEYEPAGMGGTQESTAMWTQEADGDLMPQWTLADPNTDPIPEPEPDPVMPDDVMAQITPTTIAGLTFSPSLPASVDGYRTMTGQYQSPATGAAYIAVRGRRETGGPIFACLGTHEQNWNADKLMVTGSSAQSLWAVSREGDNAFVQTHPDVALDTDPHTLEAWYESGAIHFSVDGFAPITVTTPAYAAFTTLYLNLYEYGYELASLILMDRIPSAAERAGIRAALVEAA